MPFLAPNDGFVNVFNLFEIAEPEGQQRVVDEMKKIVDTADYPGWISSTVHEGLDTPGTLNCVQWRSVEDLRARYAGEKFKKKTVPLFDQIATSTRLLQTEVAFSQVHPSRGDVVEISPDRDDYTVFIVLGVDPEQQKELLETVAQPEPWLFDVPGYRSHTYLGGLDGTVICNYAQWDSKELYDAFHTMPEEQRPADVRGARVRARALATSRFANTFRAVHTRSAG
ncbi:antibiotic biosynthesis monooxygenase family protein [Micromonospora chokoriensis]